jgi:hypothetical protein
MLVYFAFVLGVGAALKKQQTTSAAFLQAGRAIPAGVCRLAFISANLGAQEIIGMAASGAKYGISTSHFYWVGAIPAMVFLGVFMMPFYYGSRARSVPEYLRLRYDEKTRGFNAISFALMTVFLLRHLDARWRLLRSCTSSTRPSAALAGTASKSFTSAASLRHRRAGVRFARRPVERHLQRCCNFPHRRGISCRSCISAARRGAAGRIVASVPRR